MPFVEHYPVHVRKKIALGITIGVGIVLVSILIVIYTGGASKQKGTEEESRFLRFYATILENAQSYFGGKDAIISK